MNGAPRVLVTGPIPGPALALLRAGTVGGAPVVVDAWDGDEPLPRAELLARARDCHGIVCLLTEWVDEEVLRAAGPVLRVVANVAVGHNNLDVSAIHEHGAIATNTPGVLTDATADIALALILMTTRRLGEGERIIRSGEPWKWAMSFHLGAGVTGKRLGIVGMGAIGQALAQRARACGMTIAYSNRRPVVPDVVAALDASFVSLDELVSTSDVVSIHCPYSPDTHHLFGSDLLARMRPDAFLVNTARGPIVDEAALVDALERRIIAGAGLDVFEHEPAVHPGLVAREDVVLLPHLGSATVETRTAMAVLAVRNCLAVLNGEPPLTPIRKTNPPAVRR